MALREKRRYARLATRQGATVRGDGTTLNGEIRDYCRAGLYVAFERPVPPEVVRALAPASVVHVEFGTAARPMRLRATVARSLPTGLGLQVDAMPDEAMRALSDAARRSTARGATASAEGSRAGGVDRQALHQACTGAYAEFLQRLLREFHGRLPAALDAAASGGDRDALSLAAREFEATRPQVAARFTAAIREALREPQRNAVRPDPQAQPELSLVGDDQFEDWLALTTVIHQIESDLSQPLADLHRRYGALRGMALDRDTNPLAPAVVGRCFQSAIEPLSLPLAARSAAYRTLGRVLKDEAAAFYEQVNRTLAPLDDEAASRPQPRSEARSPRAGKAAAAEGGVDAPVQGALPAAGAASAGVPGVVPGAWPSAGHGPTQVPAFSPAPVGWDALRAALAGAQQPAGPGPAEAVLAAPGAVSATPVAPDVDYGLARLLQALAPGAGTAPVLPPSWTHAAAASQPAATSRPIAAASRSGPSAPHADTTPHAVLLDAAARLFGRAMAQAGEATEIGPLLARLEGPLLELAARDPSLLERPDHPARRLTDLLEQFAIATDAGGRFFDPRLRAFLDRMVLQVAQRGVAEPALFEHARDELARLLAPVRESRRARVARLQEACEARDLVRRARYRAHDALVPRLVGHEVPEVVLALLDGGWRQHLVRTAMRCGAQDAEWLEALAELDRLIAWLQPAEVSPETLRRDSGALLDRLAPALESVEPDAAARAALLQSVGRALAEVADGCAVRTVTVSPRATADRVPSSDVLDWAQRLRCGDWWVLTHDGRSTPMQLVWSSRPAGHCAFASRSAHESRETTLAELAREAAAGRAVPCADPDRPLLERVEAELLDEARGALRRQATCEPVSGLPNRKSMLLALERVPPGRSRTVGVVAFDTVRLVYSTCGVDAGESLVRRLARDVRDCVGADVALASFRDDAFAFVLPDAAADGGRAVSDALIARLSGMRFQRGEQSLPVGPSVGTARFDAGVDDPEEALRRAETACAAAHDEGRHGARVYDADSAPMRRIESLAEWAGRIDRLLAGEGLALRGQRVQPIGDDPSLLPYHEVLLGVVDGPSLRPVPAALLAAIERLGRSRELDLWVIGAVFDWIAARPGALDGTAGLAINLSPRSLASPEVAALLGERLSDPGVDPAKLMFEITESAAIDCYGAAQEFVERFRRRGCQFALDDFGSGHASYAHLKNLSTDVLKIDGAFVRDVVDSEGDRALVRSMHEVARSLGMRSVAEYVESDAILGVLREMGVDYVQGHAIHVACALDDALGIRPSRAAPADPSTVEPPAPVAQVAPG